ncbi:MAG: type II toxin-antitoxin system HicA family toxin [Bacteroidetes bacterium]|nr:type II toxin-antitoxin system HicA family toxin [Bacteroidota bacterium]
MSTKLPVISGKDFIRLLLLLGFEETRVNGSHHRLKHPDGRVTTVPVHKNDDLPKGLLRKIIREDMELELDDFNRLLTRLKK